MISAFKKIKESVYSRLFAKADRESEGGYPSLPTVRSVREKELLLRSNCELETFTLSSLYKKFLLLMDKRRPYLDGDVKVEDLARMLGSSRAKTSKMINSCVGRNFNNTMNLYRIDYALKLMEQDPNLKISEICSMSGFNNIPTFNNAFKTIVKALPSEYLRHIRAMAKKHRPR